MRTTLNIDERLLDQVLEATGERTKSKAVSEALAQYIRRIKIAELRAMAGSASIEEARPAQKAADAKRRHLLDRLRDGTT